MTGAAVAVVTQVEAAALVALVQRRHAVAVLVAVGVMLVVTSTSMVRHTVSTAVTLVSN